MKRNNYASLIFIFLTSCATSYPFKKTIPPETRDSIQWYESHHLLANGLEYGSIARSVSLDHQTATHLDQVMKEKHCNKKEDVIREPKENKPIVDAKGKTAPIWIWLCPEGSVVRAKPEGDPTSRFRREPHASKGLRFPADGPFDGFKNETAKIDNDGKILPKWPADLEATDPKVITDWANRAHTDLLPAQAR